MHPLNRSPQTSFGAHSSVTTFQGRSKALSQSPKLLLEVRLALVRGNNSLEAKGSSEKGQYTALGRLMSPGST